MIRRHWHDPRFWPWWWRSRVSAESKIAIALVGVCSLGFGGYFAANGLSGTVSPTSAGAEVRTLTVQQLITIGAGTAAARRVRPRAETAAGTGSAVGRQAVAVVAAPRTVVVTLDGAPQTHTVVLTRERVVTQPVTATKVVTERLPVTETVHSTQTVEVTTTVAVTVPVTVTVTERKRGRDDDDD